MAPPPSSVPSTPPGRTGSGLSFVLSGIMLIIYLGFILLVAYDKPFLGTTLVPGLSWGILLGAMVIVTAWLLTLIYVVASNKREGAK